MTYASKSPSSMAQQIGGSPVRLSEVQEQVERSSKVTERLQEKFKSLHERLQPVLRSTGSANTDRGESPKPTLVGHANALSNHNDQLEMLDAMLGDILDRIEL